MEPGLEDTGTGDDSMFAKRLASFETPNSGTLVAGRYRVERPIGRGSMGRIYLAEQTRVGRRVALKIINRELTSQIDILARFEREAKLLGSVKNPHVVDIYDIGETEEGDPFIAMEFADGPSLHQVIGNGAPLEAVRVMQLLIQITSALAAVHAVGAVHRDLKPANIVLVHASGGRELVKILDFGLAKIVRDREIAGRLTRAGAVIGTPEYMSPEQVTGTGVDHRADIYAVGCTAYEMLTGAPPFVGPEMTTLYKHLHEEVKAMPAAVPPALARVVLRSLAKDPERRWQSARDLHDALLSAGEEMGLSRRRLAPPSPYEVDPIAYDDGPRDGGRVPLAASRRRRVEIGLMLATAAVVGTIVGVLATRRHGGGATTTTSAATAAAGLLPATMIVSTTPPGAMVAVDGGKAQRTPIAIRHLNAGKHTITVNHRGYESITREVELVDGESQLVEVTMVHPTYQARIETVPAGATVTIDGADQGVTPVNVKLTDGEFHQIALRRDGYQKRTLMLDPAERQETMHVSLEPTLLKYGSLFVDSKTAGRLVIDGKDTGEWTPTGEIQVAPGKHQITLIDDVGVRRTVTEEVRLSEVTMVDVP
jgi:serine/threonine-protein kinase